MSRVADCPAAPQAPPQTSAWRREIRATLALAWPMVMTNLGQNAMTATDIIMMGRLGPVTLGAGTLGWSLYFAPMIFGLGLILATAPMIASALPCLVIGSCPDRGFGSRPGSAAAPAHRQQCAARR
jgi:hypothetical protein